MYNALVILVIAAVFVFQVVLYRRLTTVPLRIAEHFQRVVDERVNVEVNALQAATKTCIQDGLVEVARAMAEQQASAARSSRDKLVVQGNVAAEPDLEGQRQTVEMARPPASCAPSTAATAVEWEGAEEATHVFEASAFAANTGVSPSIPWRETEFQPDPRCALPPPPPSDDEHMSLLPPVLSEQAGRG